MNLDTNLLENMDFEELTMVFQEKVTEWTDTADNVESLSIELSGNNFGTADGQIYADFKHNLEKLDTLTHEINQLLDLLPEKAGTGRQEKMVISGKKRFDELKAGLENMQSKCSVQKISTFVERKKTEIMEGCQVEDSTYLESHHFKLQQLDQENVYDQEQVIKARDEAINRIESEAVVLNSIATNLAKKIQESDQKQTKLNSQISQADDNMGDANLDQQVANDSQKKSMSKTAWIIIVCILIILIIATIFLVMYLTKHPSVKPAKIRRTLMPKNHRQLV